MDRHGTIGRPYDQYMLEGMFNTISYTGNANKGHNEIPFYIHLIGFKRQYQVL